MDTCLQEPHYRNEGGKQGAKEAQLFFFMVDKRVCGTKTSSQKRKNRYCSCGTLGEKQSSKMKTPHQIQVYGEGSFSFVNIIETFSSTVQKLYPNARYKMWPKKSHPEPVTNDDEFVLLLSRSKFFQNLICKH